MRGNKEWKSDFLKSIAPILKEHEFSRRGNTFSKKENGLEHILNVQSSQSSTSSLWKFTINLAVRSALIASRHDCSIAEEIDHWNKRIGQVLPANTDTWWTVTDDVELAAITCEMQILLRQYALPDLMSVSTVEKLKSMWKKGIAPGLTEGQRREYLSLLD